MALPTLLPISQWGPGTPQATDITVYTDQLDTTQAASGTTKKYLRADEFTYYFGAAGIPTIAAVYLATTTPLNAVYNNGTFGVGATLTNAGTYGILIIDGVNVAVGERVLVWQQTDQAQNGIYSVTTIGTSTTNWVLTRTTDYNTPPQVKYGQIVLVETGISLNNQSFQQIANGPFVIGMTDIIFQKFDILNPPVVPFPEWIPITSPTANLTAGESFIANNPAGVSAFTLPSIAAVGTTIQIAQGSSTAWSIAQNAGQSINFGTSSTTIGTGGSIGSNQLGSSISLVCTVANLTWTTFASIGNLTII